MVQSGTANPESRCLYARVFRPRISPSATLTKRSGDSSGSQGFRLAVRTHRTNDYNLSEKTANLLSPRAAR